MLFAVIVTSVAIAAVPVISEVILAGSLLSLIVPVKISEADNPGILAESMVPLEILLAFRLVNADPLPDTFVNVAESALTLPVTSIPYASVANLLLPL